MATVDDLLDAALARHVRVATEHIGEAVAPTDARMVGVMAGELLSYVLAEREAARFGNLNAALDWWAVYRGRVLAALSSDEAEAVLKIHVAHEQAKREIPVLERLDVTGAALSDAELAELGLEPDVITEAPPRDGLEDGG